MRASLRPVVGLGIAICVAAVAVAAQGGQGDQISTSSGGNIVSDARAWWSSPTGHTDEFRTRSRDCLAWLDQAEAHRRTAMDFHNRAIRTPGQPGVRLQEQANAEYAVVTTLVRRFYECTRRPSDEFRTQDQRPTQLSTNVEKLCDMRRLAQVVNERYARPGSPIATYYVPQAGRLNTRRGAPTYLVVAQGVADESFWQYWLEQVVRSYGLSMASPEAQALARITETIVGNSYAKAIAEAIAELPEGANLILAGHSLGGMELQRLVADLKRRGHFVPYVVTFGSPIVAALEPGTRYQFVKADGDIIAGADRLVTTSGAVTRIPGGSWNPWDKENGSHHIYAKSEALETIDAFGFRRTISTPCLEIDLESGLSTLPLSTHMTYKATAFNATTLGCSITCKNVEASIAFYRDVLGFSVAMSFEQAGKLAGAVVSAGDIRIVLNQDDGKLGWDRIKGQGLYLQINVAGGADVDAAAARIKAAGGTLIDEPEDRPWGARMFQFRDLDGFKLGVSTPLAR